MEISQVVETIKDCAEHYRAGLIGMIDIEEIVLTSIIKYTDKNFVYTGDIVTTNNRNCG